MWINILLNIDIKMSETTSLQKYNIDIIAWSLKVQSCIKSWSLYPSLWVFCSINLWVCFTVWINPGIKGWPATPWHTRGQETDKCCIGYIREHLFGWSQTLGLCACVGVGRVWVETFWRLVGSLPAHLLTWLLRDLS